MKKTLQSAALVCGLAALGTPASAQDDDAIIDLLVETHRAYKACDIEALQALAHPDWFGAFNAAGGFEESTGHESLKAQCDAGYRVDFHFDMLKTEVHGDWALAAFMARPEVVAPDGTRTTSTLRASWVLRQVDGAWKRYHVHVSEAQEAP